MPRTVYVLSKSSMDAVAAMTPDWDQLAVMVKNGTLMAPKAMATVLAEQGNPASSWVDIFPFAFVEPWPLTEGKRAHPPLPIPHSGHQGRCRPHS